MKNARHETDETADMDAANSYQVVSVERVESPDGSAQTWCAYELANGDSVIRGQRRGSRDEVTRHAREFADELNQRSRHGYRPTWSAGRRRK